MSSVSQKTVELTLCQQDFQIAVGFQREEKILTAKYSGSHIKIYGESGEFLHLYFSHLAQTTKNATETFSLMRVMSFQSTPLCHLKNHFYEECKKAEELNRETTQLKLKII